MKSDKIDQELLKSGPRDEAVSQSQKKNYAETLSRALATRLANELRPKFSGILPDEHGRGQETRARSAKGYKKLDVNYSTVELGLGLGVSIKTINFRDPKSKRYTKNYTRVDGELRAEASDYHERQPFAVMIALIFLPMDSCDDAVGNGASSFGKAVQTFRHRAGRIQPDDDPMTFERVFLGPYETNPDRFGEVGFFDVMTPPPKRGRPDRLLSIQGLVSEVTSTYDLRNSPPFIWAEGEVEESTASEIDDDDE